MTPENLILEATGSVTPVTVLHEHDLEGWLETARPESGVWVRRMAFKAKAATVCLIPGEDGSIERVLAGMGSKDVAADEIWDWAEICQKLPGGTYQIDEEQGAWNTRVLEKAALGWALSAYRFDHYKTSSEDDAREQAVLVWPESCDRRTIVATRDAICLVRDLINTPAQDMGPEELADAAVELANKFDGECRVVTGRALLEENYPGIHAVGRASDREPRLVDLVWGDPSAPKLTLVGKGVCFDSGGLDLKSASGMKLMKKDMGGAAHVLGLASMVMATGLPVRLRVLIPAVENSVSGNAMRPLDVITMRNGKTVEIGNTDAEGRVVLADALAAGVEEHPDLIIDCATLTGAARVALGAEIPALFSNDDALAEATLREAVEEVDPLWRLPLWPGYRKQVEGATGDLTNAPEGGYAGAITAALFLESFVGENVPWMHLDLMAWNLRSRPGRPEGGEAMGLRALFSLMRKRYEK